jgi:hypothetical protein
VFPSAVVLACACMHVLERAIRRHLPAVRGFVVRSSWGPALEGAALGAIVMLALVMSGAGAEFIYFQF